MAVVVMLLAVLLMYCMARTAALQRAIRTFDVCGRETGGEPTGRRTQALILLGIYVTRLNGAFLVGILVYLFTSRASAWYYGAGIVALCWIGSLLVGSTRFLRLGRTEMMGLLLAELQRRRDWYTHLHDAARLQAIDELLLRLRSARRA
jgi:hypothetical protein